MRTRSVVGALGLTAVLVLLPAALAGAEFRGTDMWSNLVPSGGGGGGGLVDRHPISFYALDYHVNGPSIGFSGASWDIPALVAQFLASVLFMFGSFCMRMTISAFDWAFNIDIIGGPHGALDSVGASARQRYSSTFLPLMTSAVMIFGGWLVYKLLSRRFAEAGSGALRAVCLVAVALMIMFNPVATIGRAAALTNELTGPIVSGSTGANGGQDASNRIFRTFVSEPWAVLEFGGLKRCTSVEKDSDGFPRYVNGESAHSVCRNVMTRYAPAFLSHGPGSDERNDLYKDIKDGQSPWDKADAPAVDMMQAGGAVQRIVFTIILALGIVAGILFLGMISIAALFAQLGLLVLLAITPIMVIAGIFPGAHGIVFSWAKWIGKLLLAKVVYAVMLSAALGVSSALMAIGGTSQFGYLFAFGAQTALFFGLFLKRRELGKQIGMASEHRRLERRSHRAIASSVAGAVGVVASPVAAAGVAGAAGKARIESVKQQHAKAPDSKKADDKKGDTQTKADPPSGERKMPPDSSSPPASAGRTYSPNPPEAPVPDPPDAQAPPAPAPVASPSEPAGRGDPVPTRTFNEDYQQAKADAAPSEYGQQRRAPDVDPLEAAAKSVHADAGEASFARQLEQERAKTPSP